MRQCKITAFEVRDLVTPGNRQGADRHGNRIYVGEIRGVEICVILAVDDLSTIVTVFDLKR